MVWVLGVTELVWGGACGVLWVIGVCAEPVGDGRDARDRGLWGGAEDQFCCVEGGRGYGGIAPGAAVDVASSPSKFGVSCFLELLASAIVARLCGELGEGSIHHPVAIAAGIQRCDGDGLEDMVPAVGHSSLGGLGRHDGCSRCLGTC